MAVPGTQQTVQGRTKHLARGAIMVERTRGLLFGPDTTQLDEFRQRSDELYGEPTNLFTGLIEQPLPPEWNNHGRVFFRQKYPLPMTLLSVAPIFEVGD